MKKLILGKAYRLLTNRIRLIPVLLIPIFARFNQKHPDPYKYDLNNPQVIQLSKELKEISGIIIKDNSIYAIADDKDYLFKLSMTDGKILSEWKFGKNDNYEDVAVNSNKFYVLSSNGNIIAFNTPSAGTISTVEFEFPYGKGNEFEILYYDENIKKLIMICKDCKDDKKENLSVYAIDPLTGQYSSAAFGVDTREVAKLNNSKPERLKPSAAAIHPITGELYIVSSINKMLIRTTCNGKILAIYPLKRSICEQPEGIAFTSTGDMLISNEAGNNKRANILLFKTIVP